jgi:hypothetical protein
VESCAHSRPNSRGRSSICPRRAGRNRPFAAAGTSAFGLTQADIAEQLGIDEKTLRKHFRGELNSGKFKVDMTAGKNLVELMKSRDETRPARCDEILHRSPHGLEGDQCQRAGWKGRRPD